MADPLDIFTGAQGVTVDPNTVADQIQNLLHIVSGKPIDASMSGMTQQAQPAEAVSSPTAPAAATSSTVMPFEGNFGHSGEFGEARSGHAHAGIDFATPQGTHILAMAGGTVTQANTDAQGGGYGNFVLVDHGGGIVTRYAHLSAVEVKAGDTVSAGQTLGAAGSTGNSTGPHLHFEVIKDGQPTDPSPFLAGGMAVMGKGDAAAPTPLSPEEILAAQIQNTTDILSGKDPAADSQQKAATSKAAGTQAATGSWATDILTGIGAPLTPENISMMETWMAHEGGANHNNPLNTMLDMPGASLWNQDGVKTYGSYEQGLEANVKTLLQSNMAGIVAAFRSGNAETIRAAIRNSPWGTKNL